ncbi:general secretion pathway protein M [Pseudoduganella lurida]|uniref:General secretion pathway protein M n=1 Tax=Pseudoduganella lurida TaxID=1036180 RepID=A0A562R1Z3_9BURK|nr:type II secretion system protein M [Pseudoduganella lurida]TWI63095.1 general secretion pathway protein M [Pseudoduganella lurida]
MSVNSTIAGWRARGSAFWAARTEQERRMLAIGGAVVGLALVYSLLVDPALTNRERLRRTLPELRQEAATLQALATQAAQLSAQAPVQALPLSREALTAALAARGLATQSLVMTGEYVKIEWKGVPFAGLVTWMDAVARENRLLVQDAKISAVDTAGLVDATLTLRQQANP